jgi:hypothetical protein
MAQVNASLLRMNSVICGQRMTPPTRSHDLLR